MKQNEQRRSSHLGEATKCSLPACDGFTRARILFRPQIFLRSGDADGPPGFVSFGDTGRRSASLLFVPLRHGGQHLGVLSIQSYWVNAYDRAALELLQVLADHAAGALKRIRAEAEREKYISELKAAMAQVKTLSGLIPICAGCKKIRDGKDYWHQVDSYIAAHTDATFTHGLCPGCIKKYYPGLEEAGLDPAKRPL